MARRESAPKCDLVLRQLQCIIGHHAMNEASREGEKEGRREGAKRRERMESARARMESAPRCDLVLLQLRCSIRHHAIIA